jgi:origin recognition complex subunit 4
LLEKRVKSRYSHRQILLFPSTKLEDRLELFREYLRLESVKEAEKGFVTEWNTEIESCLNEPKLVQLLRRQLELDSNEVSLYFIYLFDGRTQHNREHLWPKNQQMDFGDGT